MGQVSPLPPRAGASTDAEAHTSTSIAAVRVISPARCALCGRRLDKSTQRFEVYSPRSVERTLTVCHLCRKAVLNEGYRPAD
jgi:hypothetical protein